MAGVTTGLSGVQAMERVLKKLPGKLAERELTSAARAGANVIRKAVRERAPESGESAEQRSKRSTSGKDYGPLKKNIRVTRLRKTSRSVEMAVHNGPAFWAKFLEWGTSKLAARPFFTPAFEASAQPALARTGKTLARRLEKTAKELAGPLSKISKGTRKRL